MFKWFRKTIRKTIHKKDYESVEPIKLSTEKILHDMDKTKPKFDLREPYWREHPDEFWKQFKGGTTDDIRVPERFRDWIIGQARALRKIYLILKEWIHTLKDIQELEKKEREGVRYSHILRERPTQNVLLLGEPGTGKSLTIKVVAEELKELYKQEGIELEDVTLVENRVNKFAPLVRYLKPAGIGRKIREVAMIRETLKGKRKTALILGGLGTLMAIGAGMMALGFRRLVLGLMAGLDIDTVLTSVASVYFVIGASLITFPMFILFIFFFRGAMGFGASSQEYLKVPNLIVDNNPEDTEMYESATIISEALLFGSIQWEALGTQGIAPYLRTSAGLIHKANKKILYIDEIKNLTPGMATKLLTAMEDGEMPIRMQSGWSTMSGGQTAELSVETPPIKAMFFLFCAGNLDVMYDPNSILNLYPALRDRFENYGDIILLEDEVEASPLNELLIAQVVRDELYRFNFPAMEAEGVREILRYVKRRASDNKHLKLMFRAVIKVLKKGAQLSWDEGDTIIRVKHVTEAIENYTASIERQVFEHELKKSESFKVISTKGAKVGVINGLSVIGKSRYGEGAGDVVVIESYLKFVDKHQYADFITSGIVEKDGFDIADSKRDVRTAIMRIYGVDIAKQCYVHIKFSQSRIDGPSAGIAMTLALMSWLGDPRLFDKDKQLKPIPMRQDIAVTGAMQIAEEYSGDIRVSAIGGVDEKARAAIRYKIPYMVLPKENYEVNVDLANYKDKIKVLPASTVLEYFNMLRRDKEDEERA